jgi:hypothetical protein
MKGMKKNPKGNLFGIGIMKRRLVGGWSGCSGLQTCEGKDLEVQIFNLKQM